MNSIPTSRRGFLLSLAACVALPACGDAEPPPSDPCMDVRSLSDPDRATRTTTNYVAESPFKDMKCDTCQFWLRPAEGAPCGGCVIVKGPIHPGGHCTSWAPA
ncbi:MAG: hypothetical protein R2834_18535 [Rhodothermales bacterium]